MNLIAVHGAARSGKGEASKAIADAFGFVEVGFADPIKRLLLGVFGFDDEQLWGDRRDEVDPRFAAPSAWLDAHGRFTAVAGGWERDVEVQHELSWDPDALYRWFRRLAEDAPKRGGLSVRHAAQQIGTEFGRDTDPEVWVRYGLRVARALCGGRGYAYDRRVGLQLAKLPSGDGAPAAPGVTFHDARFSNEAIAVLDRGGIVLKVVRGAPTLKGEAAAHRSEKGIAAGLVTAVLENNSTLEELHKQARVVTSLAFGDRLDPKPSAPVEATASV